MKVNKFLFCVWIVAALAATGCKSTPAGTPDPRETNRVIDSSSVAYLKGIDKSNKNAVFVLTKNYPELAKLKNKVIHIKPLNQDLSINMDEYLHKDYMGPIYILLPAYYTGVRASVILKCFPGYKGFTFKDVSDNYVLYYTDKKR